MSTDRPACDFTELLLGTLGHGDGEFTSLLYLDGSGPHTAVMAPHHAVAAIAQIPVTADIFFGVNPVRGPTRTNAGRGSAADVTRLVALWCDLDVKPGGCPSMDVARAIVANLAIVLGTRPSVTVDSGHGLHAYWPIEFGAVDENTRALLRRWGRLVAAAASQLNAHVDSVFDLPRMMRVPGSFNNKKSA